MTKTLIIFIFSLVALFLFVKIANNVVYQNISISEPLGYYLALPSISINKGDLVFTCISNNSYKDVFMKLGMKEEDSACKNKMPYLLKRIAAESGDVVEVTSNGIMVNDQLQKNSQQYKVGRGIQLYPLPIGYKYQLGANEYFMLGQSPHSVDSRYFGIINKKDIFRRAFLIYKTDKLSLRN